MKPPDSGSRNPATRCKEALNYGARSRAAVERGEKPPHRAVQVIHGDAAREMAANNARNMAQGRLIPIEIFCRKR